jgi:hypothetical protein
MAALGPLEIGSMRALSQLAAIVAIAVGAGLFQFGRHLDPPLSAATSASMRSIGQHEHEAAALASGWGAAFMTLGGLMLVVPWIDMYAKRHCPSGDSGTA